VIASWHDQGNFRARITRTDPDNDSGKSSVVVDTKASVLDVVAEWIAGLEPDVNSSN
jgi:hypothetical protein